MNFINTLSTTTDTILQYWPLVVAIIGIVSALLKRHDKKKASAFIEEFAETADIVINGLKKAKGLKGPHARLLADEVLDSAIPKATKLLNKTSAEVLKQAVRRQHEATKHLKGNRSIKISADASAKDVGAELAAQFKRSKVSLIGRGKVNSGLDSAKIQAVFSHKF